MTGKKYPLRIERHHDKETGAVANRFVHKKPSQEQIFYYCSPGMTPDGRYIPCWSNVSGQWQIHVIDRQEEVSVQLSEIDYGRDGSLPYKFACDSPCLSLEYARIFYPDGRKVRWVDIHSCETDWLFEAPEGYHLTSLSARGRYLAFSYSEDIVVGQLNTGKWFFPEPVQSFRPRSIIVVIDIEEGTGEYLWGEMNYLCHVEMCPFDETLVMFCNQGSGNLEQQVFVINRRTTGHFAEDRKPSRVLFGDYGGKQGRHVEYLGHNYFSNNGFIAGWYVECCGTDERGSFTDEASFSFVIKPDGTGMRKAKFPGSKKPCHVHCQRAEGLWVGDHWVKPDGSVEMGWISLMRNRFETQEMDIALLLRTGHHWGRPFHPHPWITPAEDEVVTAYNTGKEDNHMAVIEIPDALRGL